MADYDPDIHCGAQKANDPGSHCTRPKGWGTDHPTLGRCKWHGGSTPSHNAAAERELLIRDCKILGLPLDVTPEQALLDAVKEAAGNVRFYRAMIQELRQHPLPDEYITDDEPAEDGGGQKGHWIRGEPGIYGRTYHVSGLPTGEAKAHILVALYNQERDRLDSYVRTALQHKVAERLVALAESDAAAVAQAQINALVAMGLAARLEEFRQAFYEHLQPHIEPVPLSA